MVLFYISQDFGLAYCHRTIEGSAWLPSPKREKGGFFQARPVLGITYIVVKMLNGRLMPSLVFLKNLVQRVGSEENNFVNTRFRCILTDLEESQSIEQNDCHP